MEFTAIIRKVSAKHTVVNDKVVELVLQTENPMVLDLGKIPAETLYRITVEIDEAKAINSVEME